MEDKTYILNFINHNGFKGKRKFFDLESLYNWLEKWQEEIESYEIIEQ